MFAAEAVTPVTQAITFALVGGFFTVLSLVLTNRAKRHTELDRRAEKEEDRKAEIAKEQRDYARQDLVAQRADERAETLLISSRAALQTTQQVVTMTRRNGEKLDVVEFLGNSHLTAQFESRLATLRISLALAKEVAELQRSAGREPSPETSATILSTEGEIVELEQTIVQRKVADAQSVAMLAQPTLDREAADLQIEAAATQTVAADKQQRAAEQITTAMAPTPLPPPPPP